MRVIQILSVVFLLGMVASVFGCSPGAPSEANPDQATVPPPPPPIPPMPAGETAPQQSAQIPTASSAQTPTSPAAVPAVGPIPAAPEDLIANGSFVRWDEGQYVPRHWTLGFGFNLDEMPFKLERLEDPLYSDGFAVRQTWTESDVALAFEKVFGQTIDGLKPNTGYRLDVVAHNESKNTVIISAFEMEGYEEGRVGSGKATERLNLEAAVVTPSTGLVTYTGSFITNDSGTVKLGARVRGENPVLPGSVIWDSWTLVAVN